MKWVLTHLAFSAIIATAGNIIASSATLADTSVTLLLLSLAPPPSPLPPNTFSTNGAIFLFTSTERVVELMMVLAMEPVLAAKVAELARVVTRVPNGNCAEE